MSPIAQLAERAAPLLQQPHILSVRRNHGLEHATIHILNRQGYRLSGRSDGGGFYLLGDAPSDKVEAAVKEALERMKAGESGLAVHPNCGTNLVTAGLLTTAVGYLGFAGQGRRDAWKRFNTVMTLTLLVIMFAPALGGELQRHFTTAGDMGDLRLAGVKRHSWQLPFGMGQLIAHRVATEQATS